MFKDQQTSHKKAIGGVEYGLGSREWYGEIDFRVGSRSRRLGVGITTLITQPNMSSPPLRGSQEVKSEKECDVCASGLNA